MSQENKALVILSGGQDSTTCLHWAFRQFGKENVDAVTFDYKQKHSREIECARSLCIKHNVAHTIVEMPKLEGTSPLTGGSELGKYERIEDLPGGVEPTFIPGRNIIFLALSSNIAGARSIDHLVTGVCQADFGGYADCREVFIRDMEQALNLGLGRWDVCKDDNKKYETLPGQNTLNIDTPLMYLTKRQTVFLAKELGKECWEDLAWSHTCYEGTEKPCCKCHACWLRVRGFIEAGYNDPLLDRYGIDINEVYNSIKGV